MFAYCSFELNCVLDRPLLIEPKQTIQKWNLIISRFKPQLPSSTIDAYHQQTYSLITFLTIRNGQNTRSLSGPPAHSINHCATFCKTYVKIVKTPFSIFFQVFIEELWQYYTQKHEMGQLTNLYWLINRN